MANTTTIILKNSGTTGNVPTSANMQFGELAINYADGLLFYKAANGTVLSISGSGGAIGNGQAAFDQANVAYNQANTKVSKTGDVMTGLLYFDSPVLSNTSLAVGVVQLNNGIDVFADNTAYYAQLNWANTNFVYVDSDGAYLESSNGTGINVFARQNLVDVYSNTHFWNFNGDTGSFVLPGSTAHIKGDANYFAIWTGYDTNVGIEAIGGQYIDIAGPQGIHIISNTGFGSAVTWTFDRFGGVTFPDAKIQNTAFTGFATDNVARTIANAAFDKANTGTTANAALLYANLAYDKANTANIIASGGYDKANVANVFATAAFSKANTANITADSAFARANAANLIANLAYDKANTANVFAVAAFAAQNVTSGVANAAFNAANTMVMKTGNTMTGQLVMAVGTSSISQNTGSIIINGGLGLSGNVYISNSSYYGFANTSNVSVAKIQYNSASNSIDFVFG